MSNPASSTNAERYLLGHRAKEDRRLRRQAAELAGESGSLFDRIGIGEGASVIELGFGPQGCLEHLSHRVRVAGTVIGVEQSQVAATLAKSFVSDHGLSNVRVLHADACDSGLPAGQADFVTSRLVLINIPHPEEVVGAAASLVRPGGIVAFHEAIWPIHMYEPGLLEWDRLRHLVSDCASSVGIALGVGLRLGRLLRDAGLVDVGIQPLVHVYPPGHRRRSLAADFVANIDDQLVRPGLATRTELAGLVAALRRHEADPETLVLSAVYVQAWGRKPGSHRARAKAAGQVVPR